MPWHDELANLINGKATELYSQLSSLQVERLGLPDHCLYYFRTSHFNRLFFSIETSAHLLYRSIAIQEKPVPDIVMMDYGAGVGTLYMLAKMIGCKKVIYNDFLEEWRLSALKIAEAMNIKIDEYILGDIDNTLAALEKKRLSAISSPQEMSSNTYINSIIFTDRYKSINPRPWSIHPQPLIFTIRLHILSMYYGIVNGKSNIISCDWILSKPRA